MSHRGPDAQGISVLSCPVGDQTVALGHQRLSIFDLSPLGRQPMEDAAGRTIVFNGEIFNWKELRLELESTGYTFQSQSDTEVILAAYDAWGRGCVERFNGFWSFVIYDAGVNGGKPHLFVSRDRLGIKPLYVYRTDDVLAFGSEITPILKALGVPADICPEALGEFLVYEDSRDIDQTLYKNVREVSPATNMVVSLVNGAIESLVYWRPEQFSARAVSDSAALEEFCFLIEDSTRLRLRSDVEVALTLSGGVDSSAIAAAVAANGSEKIRAFTSTFGVGSKIDETGYAQQVARKFHLEHVLVDALSPDIDKDESDLSRHMELLYSSFSQLVNWLVIKSVHAHGIKVFLNGQGGDELFMGYERYYAPYLLRSGFSLRQRLKEFSSSARNSRLSSAELAAFLIYFTGSAARKYKYRRQSSAYLSQALNEASKNGGPYVLSRDMRELTIQETCGAQLRRLLRFDDRICSAFGMEGRPVFLDHRMVEFGISLPVHHKIRDGWTKFIVRKYLEAKGLPEIAWRKSKLGFPAPNQPWTLQLIKERATKLRQSSFIQSALALDVDVERLDYRLALKVLMLESAARELNWQPLGKRVSE